VELTNEDVADILAVLDSLPYDEVDLQTTRFRLTLRRSPGGWTEESQTLAKPSAITHSTASAEADESDPPTGPAGEDADGMTAVLTPLPGTFYRAPRPGAAPFVEVGDTVGPDTVVAIVETMKLMNSVPAGAAGRVARICLQNAEFAAQGSTLMLIEPDA
jgi:acetyl-CoA carboxylase biotin carboxyl carrier protein